MSFDSVNTCYDCWDKIQRLEDDLPESFSDADEGLLINYEGQYLSKFVQIYMWIPIFLFNFNIEYDRQSQIVSTVQILIKHFVSKC